MKIEMNKPRRAGYKEEATHRFPTSVYWGEGYFGDKMRYIVAAGDAQAWEFAKSECGVPTLPLACLQRRNAEGGWNFCEDEV